MLDNVVLSESVEGRCLELFTRIFENLQASTGTSSTGECPFNGTRGSLIERLENSPSANTVVQETWLLFLPILIQHQQCTMCADNFAQLVREQCLRSALEIIASTHREVVLDRALAMPLFAAARILKAGCVLAVMIRQGWEQHQTSLSMFLKCTEVLTACGSRWARGDEYCNVWRTICSALTTPE